jgi:N-acetylmuramoyl-L-alanine amidase
MLRSAFAPDSCVVAEVLPSPNHGERAGGRQPDMILLHYTGMADSQAALRRLASPNSEVSSHYLVFENGTIIQMVQEARRAWHAGDAFWSGETDVNSRSIGIEIANPGHSNGYPNFPKRQIAAVTALCRSILTRHAIPAERVLAHSDVAPSRKEDPGEKFPWQTLYDSGVGHWVRPTPISAEGEKLALGDRGAEVEALQKALAEYGYGLTASGDYDYATHQVMLAFQRHFRPQRVDGVADPSSRETLHQLLAQRGRTRTIAARTRNAMFLIAS